MPARIVLALLFIAAGLFHFLIPHTYVAIMPSYLPAPLALVYVSGLCEMLGGVGLLFNPPLRRIAAWGLVALLIAVFPANLNMALHPANFPAIPAWTLWLRLPLQLPLIWWAWLYTRP
jgi:uncharacterized membrane protein